MIIYDVPTVIKEQELLPKIVAKNLEFLDEAEEKIKIVGRVGPRGKDRVHLIAQVASNVRDIFLSTGRVFINWNSCQVKDWNHVNPVLQVPGIRAFGC